MSEYKTEQEVFWAGEFGTDYISRNKQHTLFASNLNFFSKALSRCQSVESVIEFGANIGLNLKVLELLFPSLEVSALEINGDAVKELQKFIPPESVYHSSILDFQPQGKTWELSVVKGVLIHINPDELDGVYETIVNASSRYILIGEYYNPSPVAIPYRGHTDKLFKRDFAGEIMTKFPNLRLLDYGFAYRNDPVFPQDDITWFLLEKPSKRN